MPPVTTLLPNEDGMDDPGIPPSPHLWETHHGPHDAPPPGGGGRGPFIVLMVMVAVAVVFLVQIFLR